MTVGGLIILVVVGYNVLFFGGGMVAARIDRGYWGRSRHWSDFPIAGYGGLICLIVTLVVFCLTALVQVIVQTWGVPL